MRIIRGLNGLQETFPRPVITLGNFDGVHLGHQAILQKVIERARIIGGTSMAFTFEPHPLKVLAPERSPRLLNTFHGKMRFIAASGLDAVICANFTRSFAEQDPEDFARNILHEKLGVVEVYVGYDYAFGKGREGSIEFLKQVGLTYGFQVGVIEAVRVDDMVVSSSAIRDLIATGQVEIAAKLLGRSYSIEGHVVHGVGRGQKLGFPTANIKSANELVPALGVYAVRAAVDHQSHNGVAAIGVRPTFDSGPVSIEVFLFDFHGDIYGKQIDVSFVKRLRGEVKFANADALIQQINDYVRHAHEALQQS